MQCKSAPPRETSHKRAHSTVEDTPQKMAKLTGPAYVADVEEQLKDLHEFIIAKNLVLQLPPKIRKYFDQDPDAAKNLAGSIRSQISRAYDRLEEDCYNSRKTGISSDDISSAMVPFIHEIEKLSRLPEGLKPAFELTLHLGSMSYAHLDDGACGYGDRPSDEAADNLCCELARRIKDEDKAWSPQKEVDDLEEEIKTLEDYGIENYFQKSLKLLSSYV